mmetsp:Transcript_9244/g.12842  ORF Transcript_9244/g.12842 Transcript_9244/m.12842 type:complete len:161 (-) Transcript_9244:206-688(-)
MVNQSNDPAVDLENKEEVSNLEANFSDDELDDLLDARTAMEEMKELSRRVGVYAIKTRYDMSKKRRKETKLTPERKRRKLHDEGNFNPTLEDILNLESSDKKHLVRMMKAYKNMQAMYQTFTEELNFMVRECECEGRSQHSVQTETNRSIAIQEDRKPTE